MSKKQWEQSLAELRRLFDQAQGGLSGSLARFAAALKVPQPSALNPKP